jgi:regulation of enolase protein 1 (concanavalin A-like superfamily)
VKLGSGQFTGKQQLYSSLLVKIGRYISVAVSFNTIDDNKFRITANENTDYFRGGINNYYYNNAPYYYDEMDSDFVIQVKIMPVFVNTYDAGGILIYGNETKWIKAAFELTDLGYRSIVSVVTNKYSDDSNNEITVHSRLRLTQEMELPNLQLLMRDENHF